MDGGTRSGGGTKDGGVQVFWKSQKIGGFSSYGGGRIGGRGNPKKEEGMERRESCEKVLES